MPASHPSLAAVVTLAAFCSLGALALSGCRLQGQDANKERELQLRSYKVPAGAGQQLRAVLSSVLFLEKDKSVGRVSLSPDGQLVVLGPPEVQHGVAQLVRDFPSTQKAPSSVELTYWVLRGKPGGDTKDAPDLGEIAQAVKAIAGQGVGRLELIERLRLRSLVDERAQIQGSGVEISQTASIVDGRVIADLRLHRTQERRANRLETRVQLQPGQLVVLAESGEDANTLFYVVRANAAEAK